MKVGEITEHLIDAYIELRDKSNIDIFKRFNVVITMHPQTFIKFREEQPYGIRRDSDDEIYYTVLCNNKTPIIISDELPKDVEFIIQTQKDYERLEKEKMFERFNKMFFDN